MLGVIVCSHAKLAEGIKSSVDMILGEQENFATISFFEGDDVMELSQKIKDIASKYEENNQKYVVLVDLYGASPFNASAIALNEYDTNIISGVSLPLVLELLTCRNSYNDYDEFLENCLNNSKDSMKIIKMTEMFKGEEK